MKRLFYAAVTIAMLATHAADDIAEQTEALFATSNLWGTTTAEYDAALGAALRPLKGQTDVQCLWFAAVCDYAEFPSGAGDSSWLMEKRRLLWLNLPRKVIVSSTNCWCAVAAYLGRLKEQVRPELQELEDLIQTGSVIQTPLNDTASESLKAYLSNRANGLNADFAAHRAIRSAILQTARAVTNDFPCAILPQMDATERTAIVSNIAERARLTEAEASVLWPTNVVDPVVTE